MARKNDSLLDPRDLKTVLKVARNNWYVVVLGLMFATVIALIYTYKTPDIYAAKAQILLKSNDTYNYQEGIYRSVGAYMSYENIANQQRILTSYNLIDKAISKLDLDISYYIVGRVRTQEVYQAVPYKVEVQYIKPQLYEVPIDFRVQDADHFLISYEFNNQQFSGTYRFDTQVQDPNMLFTVHRTELLKEAADGLSETNYQFVAHSRPHLIYKYRNALTIENLEYTTVLEVTLEDEIPSRAVTFLDTLSKVYIDYTLQSQIDINENTTTYIDKQLDEVIEILSGIEDDLENFRRDKSILNLNREESLYFEKYFEFDGQKRSLMLQLQAIDDLERYIQENQDVKNERLLPPSMFVDEKDEFLLKNIQELFNLQVERNTALFDAKEGSKAVDKVDDRIELLKKDILIYLYNQKKAISERINDINNQLAQFQGMIKSIPKTQRDLLNINRKLQVNEKMYLYLLEKKANTIIARAGIIPETKLIESARSVGKVKPDKTRIFRLFLLGGFLLSLVIIVIRHIFFNKIETVEELKGITSLPVLGEIIYSPSVQPGNTMVVNDSPKAPITESFRGLRTNLEYVVSDERNRVILVTSHSPGEGKTFVSINLAGILAKAGKKVLIVEMDLHKPKVSKDLGISAETEKGVSSILSGKHTVEESVITSFQENLDILLAGPTPPNASELILSQRLDDLLKYARSHYDYVIIDSAPIGLISDAIVLMKHMDTTLFIVNTRVGKAEFVSKAEELVLTNELKNFGFVLNGVKLKKSRFYYNASYGYRYGYTYGYGYSK